MEGEDRKVLGALSANRLFYHKLSPPSGALLRIGAVRASANLWLKPDASQHVCESWIRAQAIEPWLNFETTYKHISCVVGLFQPSDCLIFIPQPSINICEYIWPNISEFRLLLL